MLAEISLPLDTPEMVIVTILVLVMFGAKRYKIPKCPPTVCGPIGDLSKNVKPIRCSSSERSHEQS